MKSERKIVPCLDSVSSLKRTITSDDARKILHEHGLDISQQEATDIVDFLYLFALFSLKYSKRVSNESS